MDDCGGKDLQAQAMSGKVVTVSFIDDAGQIHMRWDNGRTLAIIPQVDSFRKLTEQELQEEQQNIFHEQAELMSMNMT